MNGSLVRRRGAALVVAGVAGAAVVAVVLVAVGTVAGPLAAEPAVRYGLVAVRVVANAAGALCVGSLLMAALLLPRPRSGTIDVDGFAALRTASAAAVVWVVAAVATAVLTLADALALPVSEVLEPGRFVVLVGAMEQPKAWLVTAAFALVLAVGCRQVLTRGGSVALFAVAVLALTPVALTGHSATGGSHDVATNSLLFHVTGAALWVGGLFALLALARRDGAGLPTATARFSRLALACWVVIAASGVVNALVRVSVGDLLTTTYGRMLVAKVVLLGVLGLFGHRQRAVAVAAVRQRGDRRALRRLAISELAVMAATFGVAVALGRTPPPGQGTLPSTVEQQIGYELAGPPTVGRLLFDWRFDLVFGTLAVVLAVAYLAGVRRVPGWPVGRTVAWLSGCLVLLVATSSGIGRYAPAQLGAHVASHALLAMIVPVLLVLGGPVTLALRARHGGAARLVRSPLVHALTRMPVALAVFVGPFYLLYVGGGLDWALGEHWRHLAMNVVFLVGGYAFFWPVLGGDPGVRRPSAVVTLGWMFAVVPAFGLLAVIMSNSHTGAGAEFYTMLDLPWVTDLAAEERGAGGLLWILTELPALILLVVTAVLWSRADDRSARRPEETDELADYNAMLARLDSDGR